MKISTILAVILTAILMIPTESAQAQSWPSAPTFSYGCMTLRNLTFNDINNHTVSGCNQRQYGTLKTEVEAGTSYTLTVQGGCYNGSSCYYGQYVRVWIDWNIDGDFNDAGELAASSYNGSSFGTHNINIAVPDDAVGGSTMMRVVNRWYPYGWPSNTGSNSGYGDYSDIQLDIKSGTANPGIVDINNPVSPFLPGTYTVTTQIQNFGEANVTSYEIGWSVDGVDQGTKTINTNLGLNQMEEIELGEIDVQYKPDYSPYTVEVWIDNPNGELEDCSLNAAWCNDNDMTKGFAPSLAPGQYTVGGSNPFFPTLANAVFAINAANILGSGQVELLVRPGTYTGNLEFDQLGSAGNTWWIHSVTGNPNDVRVIADQGGPLFQINDMQNITIEGIGFETSLGGGFNIENVDNLTINNCSMDGMDNPGFEGASILLNLYNVNNLSVNNCTFMDGSVAIQEMLDDASMCPRSLSIQNSTFNGFAYKGAEFVNTVCTSGVPSIDSDDDSKETGNETQAGNSTIVFNNNNFIGASGLLPSVGFHSTNDNVSITNNQFTGYERGDAVIELENDGTINGFTGTCDILNNNIAQTQNMPGVLITGYADHTLTGNNIDLTNNQGQFSGIIIQADPIGSNAWIEDNSFATSNGWVPLWCQDISDLTIIYNSFHNDGGNFGLYVDNSTGNIANNTISGNGSQAIQTNNANLGLFYNTFATTADLQPTAYFINSTIEAKRNIFQNWGNGAALWAQGCTFDDAENVFFTNGPNVVQWNGLDVAVGNDGPSTIQAIQNNTFMNATDSYFFEVLTFSNTDLRLNAYYPEMVWDVPLFDAKDWRSWTIEQFDAENSDRNGFYYAGADNITPIIEVLRNPIPIAECVGTDELNIYTVASATEGVEVLFQWYKDGAEIPYNEAILYFDDMTKNDEEGLQYHMSGVYYCEAYGAGAARVRSEEVLVNVLRPIEITQQPGDMIIEEGGELFWEVGIHIHGDDGLDDPLLNPEFQWFKNTDPPTAIENDQHLGGRFAGAQSSILSIKNIQSEDYENGYYVEITGECGTTTSDVSMLYQAPDVAIAEQPMAQQVCEGEDAIFMVTADQTGAPREVMYQWWWEGAPLEEDNTFQGVNTNELTIVGAVPAFNGELVCQVWIDGMDPVLSDAAMLTVDPLPAISGQTTDTEVTEGDMLELSVTAENATAYQWWKDGEMIDDATDMTYSVEAAMIGDAGEYVCQVTNDCGEVLSEVINVTVTTGGGTTSVNDGAIAGMVLSNTPNPFSATTTINFTVAQPSFVTITVTDANGNEVATIFNSEVSGNQQIEFNANDHNLASGVYYYTLQSNGNMITKQMVVVK